MASNKAFSKLAWQPDFNPHAKMEVKNLLHKVVLCSLGVHIGIGVPETDK